jgi:Zn-dependent protease with chaperone function
MRYVAKQAREGINVSKTHPLIEASLLIGGLGVIFAVIVLGLIFLVELSLYVISPEKEAAMFSGWVPDDLIVVSEDEHRQQEVQALVDRLVLHWPDAHYDFRVAISASDLPNAFALPGGLIVVSQGLLDQVESENELAFVLGHELGHFRNRDHLRGLGRGVLVSMFLLMVSGKDVTGLNMTIANVTLMSFGRKQESQSDEFGLRIVNAEYGHVADATDFFQRRDAGEQSRLFANYLSTHPDSGDRVGEMNSIAARNRWPTVGNITRLSWVLIEESPP